MHICGYVPPWLCQILACMGMRSGGQGNLTGHYSLLLFPCIPQKLSRGCLGCFPNPPLIKGQAMNKGDISEDFWSSSAFEIDQIALQSQKSLSAIGLPSDPQSSAGIQIDSTECVNHGLVLWNQMRRQWVRVGNRRPGNKKHVGEPIISWNSTYESLMGTNKPFPRPIPLGEMVDFLVDIWEMEGLYD
ncbi:hypothetical protein VNO78_00910 [Psophocarpus tetragonolobus]|uniref:Gag1-like clamp domain-containing protein n=1 Tax=Psophocarpus tetragonolobus TaxID=3891 RepID=A0AAN9XUX8_PSOTE